MVQLDVKNKEELIRSSELQVKMEQQRSLILALLLFTSISIAVLILILFRFKAQKEKTEVAGRMARLEENEKNRLSVQLHDLISPVDTLIGRIMPSDLEDVSGSKADDISELTGKLRLLSHLLDTKIIKRKSLPELLISLRENYAIFSDLQIDLELPEEFPLIGEELKRHVYFIILELINNAVKHVKQGKIAVSISFLSGNLYVLYEDHAQGFDLESVREKGVGIGGIFDRAFLCHGKAHLESSPGIGTKWTIVLPL